MNHLRYCPLCGARIDLDVPGTCTDCGSPHFRNARPTAGGLVTRDLAVLLVKRAFDPFEGHWDIPGGFCDGPELPVDAAVREVFEETGLRTEPGDLVAVLLDTYDMEGVHFDTLNHYYELHAPTADLTLDPAECTDARWFRPDQIPWTELAFPAHQTEVLERWAQRQSDQVV